MEAGSNVLTITSEAYSNGNFSMFQVGDPIIVATGGEEGAGMFGTVGVGGIYTATPDGNFYNSMQNPIALRTTVVTISGDGKTLTLADPAVVATTDAEIWFNNQPIIQGLHVIAHAPGWTETHPEGTFGIGDAIGTIALSAGWIIKGAGKNLTKFKLPKGCSGSFFTFQSHGIELSDFSLIGNVEEGRFGRKDAEYQVGIILIQTDNAIVHDFAAHDIFLKGVWAQESDNATVTDCETIVHAQKKNYLADWFFGANDAVGGTFTRCTVDSPYLVPGFEFFRSNGGSFIDCGGRNCAVSSNSSGSFAYTRFNITIEPMTQPNEPSDNPWHHLNPLVNINSNIQPPDASMLLGGTITDIAITIQGHINSEFELVKGIVINVDNPNITVSGGSITYQANADIGADVGCAGLNSTGDNTIVENFTVVGNSRDAFDFNITVDDGAVTNCTATLINCVGPGCVLT